jgi:phytoene dehydrogenase-like protein
MSENFDVVIAGAGHNALILGCYLAKAGQRVCIAERKEKAGGSVATDANLTGSGFRQDICSVSHSMLMANPMYRNDELELISRFGLEYAQPERMTGICYDDGTVLEFWSDLERTVESMAKISETDARNFESFVKTVDATLDMLVMGMFSVPPTAGMQAMMMDATPEGQELLRLQAISAWDLICEHIEHPKIRIALARYASEAMLNPFDNGTGFGFYIILPYMYRYGPGICIGGSGSFADSLVKCFESHGGTLRLNAPVSQVLLEDGEARGLVLQGGETIRASKAVVMGLHIKQVFPHMVPGAELPAGFEHRVKTIKHSDFQPMTVHLALKEPLKFKAMGGESDFFWLEASHTDVEEFRMKFQELQCGHPVRDFAAWVQQFRADPSRVPEGQATLHIYAFMPIDLADGGREKWDEIGAEVAQGFIDDLAAHCTNLTEDNIIDMHFMTPLDISRYNTSLINADIMHSGAFSWQLGGNRPVPGWAEYRMPVPKLYMTGASTHPNGGVTGAPGRNSAQVVFEDLGLDFDKVTSN